MGRIQSSIGLVTGVPIQDTINQLLQISARPLTLTATRNQALREEQVAVTELTALVLGVQFASDKLGEEDIFDSKNVESSNSSALSAVISGDPTIGSRQFTPLREAQSQQLISSGVASLDEPLGAGSLSFQFGGFIDEGISLEQLNGGQGVQRGKIRISDRSGSSTIIDLRAAQTIDDVIETINSSSEIDVTAVTSGDALKLIDNTGQSFSNLKVSDIGTGSTAADLGLTEINVAANSATGGDILRLYDKLSLNQLNGGNGVVIDDLLPDLEVTFSDRNSVTIDLFEGVGDPTIVVSGATDSTNGPTAEIIFTAVKPDEEFADYSISFIYDDTVTAGSEIVEYDQEEKTIAFRIERGTTTADDVIQALANDPFAGADFVAEKVSGDLFSVGEISAANGIDAQVTLTSLQAGPESDGITIRFIDDGIFKHGREKVVFDDSDPLNKTLTFHIEEGVTTATDIINVVENDSVVSELFSASLAEGSTGTGLIDLTDQALTTGGTSGLVTSFDIATTELDDTIGVTKEKSLGELIDTINKADPERLNARISDDGDRIILTDLTEDDGGSFSVKSTLGGSLAEDLGLTGEAVNGEIISRRLVGGLKTSLLSDLNGGAGLGELGLLDLTDRSGNSTTVDLSQAQTLEDVLQAINSAGLGIEASINEARNGIALEDVTGQTVGNFIVSNGADLTNTADILGITTNDDVNGVNSGSLNLQVVSENTTLDSLHGGQGIQRGKIILLDSAGVGSSIDLRKEEIQTIGDVINKINDQSIGVEARINDAGDGILLIDTAGGERRLKVQEVGVNSTTAADLGLLGEGVDVDIDGTLTQLIDGSTTLKIEIDEEESLNDLIDKINALDAGITASSFSSGSGLTPHRLSLVSQVSGKAGELQIDSSNVGLSFDEIVKAQDALLLFGSSDTGGVIATSSTNRFRDVIDGVNLTITGSSTDPVTIDVQTSDTSIVSNGKLFVDQFNKLVGRLKELTFFDETDNSVGVLFGSNETLRIETELSRLMTGRFFGIGNFQSLEEIGFEFKQDGTLFLNESLLKDQFRSDPDSLREFFTSEERGVAKKIRSLIETFAGRDSSLLVNRSQSLQRKIGNNEDRIEFLTKRLEAEREKLLRQFYNMELAIGKLQNNLSAISGIQALPPIKLRGE